MKKLMILLTGTALLCMVSCAQPCSHARIKEVGATAASCTEDGNRAYWSCPDCGRYFSDARGRNEIAQGSWIVAVAHTLVPHAYSAPTETTTGQSAYWHCSVCRLFFDDAKGTHQILDGDWVLPRVFSITFDKNTPHGAPYDPSFMPGNTTVSDGSALLKPQDPTSNCCTFLQWCTDAAGTVPYDFSSSVTGSMTLYATWRRNNCTLDGIRYLIQGVGSSLEYKIIGYSLGITSFKIRETIDGNPVTTIDENALANCMTAIGPLTIPATIREIGYGAFQGSPCTGPLVIPATVQKVGSLAFRNCTGFTSLTVESPDTVVAADAFQGTTLSRT